MYHYNVIHLECAIIMKGHHFYKTEETITLNFTTCRSSYKHPTCSDVAFMILEWQKICWEAMKYSGQYCHKVLACTSNTVRYFIFILWREDPITCQENHNYWSFVIPEDWIACERARQAAVDKLPFSMCPDIKSFSSMGQKTVRSASIGSSAEGPVDKDIGRWLNTVPILKWHNQTWEPDENMY